MIHKTNNINAVIAIAVIRIKVTMMTASSEFDILFGLGYNLGVVRILSLVPASDFLFLIIL